jgi:adenine-specific DNA-methyltransferase
MKAAVGVEKLRGGYYTPVCLAKKITDWAIRTDTDSVLEPSCGDGSFIGSVVDKLSSLGCNDEDVAKQVLGIEFDEEEAAKSGSLGATIYNQDFFLAAEHLKKQTVLFDAVVGNPPFIRYQSFDESVRQRAFQQLKSIGLSPNKMTNSWVPFLIVASTLLNDNGRLGMVIPAELLQVNYAEEARKFLTNHFEALMVITFKDLVFENIQQEVVIVLAEKRSARPGIRVVALDDTQGFMGFDIEDGFANHKMANKNDRGKWLEYYLTSEEQNLIDALSCDTRVFGASQLFDINVGLVSGENDFFVINETTLLENGIADSAVEIISRANQVTGLRLTQEKFAELVRSGKKVFLFYPGSPDALSEECLRYIRYGESKEYHKNYKCRIRNPWYNVPMSWKPDAFLLRQVGGFPRIVLNENGAHVTDTLHKIRFHEGIDRHEVACAFINSYTFALCEVLGRSYGGGVLTFEPSEARAFRIPMYNADKLDFEYVDKLVSEGRILDALDYNDKMLLQLGLGLTKTDVVALRGIWMKMRDRRLHRKATTSKC